MRTALYMAFPIISAVVLLGCTLTAPAPSGNLLQNRQVADVTSAAGCSYRHARDTLDHRRAYYYLSRGVAATADRNYIAPV
jgi:hypothetical protein